MQIAALIPAYNPPAFLVELAKGLANSKFAAIIVVNDGSRDHSDQIFKEIEQIEKITLLKHAVNMGKGAALKTGLNHIYCNFSEYSGVIVIDADGQHLVEDALKVADTLIDNPLCLVMGVRNFDRNVPLRSRIGNRLTGFLFRVLTGTHLVDTQTGLRGIPRSFIPVLLKINASGYEFELDMLLACKYTGRPMIQQPIHTVYIEDNRSSHFNPIVDSMKIYFVLFRFTLTSLLSAVIDNSIFIMVYNMTFSIPGSQVSARIMATACNYMAVRRIVFYSEQKITKTLPKYLSLVCISGLVSFFLINVLITVLPLSVIWAKICAESLVFLANFAIQRDFIFAVNDKR
jgi:glycosyltransferase involved in cell wall biosynthesis